MGYLSRPQARNGMGQRLRTPYCDHLEEAMWRRVRLRLGPRSPFAPTEYLLRGAASGLVTSPDETWLPSTSAGDPAAVGRARRARIAERAVARRRARQISLPPPAARRSMKSATAERQRVVPGGAASRDACCRCCPRRSTDSPRPHRQRPRRAPGRRPTTRCRAPGRG